MKKVITLLLAIVMALSVMITPAQAASNPTDVSGHAYESDIRKLDGYNALTDLVYQGSFRPDTQIKETEFVSILTKLFPGRSLNVSGTSANVVSMSWACSQLQTAATALGYTTSWAQIANEQLTRGRACMLISRWLDSNAGIKGMVGTTTTPAATTNATTANGFYGPDGAWYYLKDGYTSAQNGNGFWYGPSSRWFYYQYSGSYTTNTAYGYWQNNRWYDNSSGTTNNSSTNNSSWFYGPDGRSYYVSNGYSSAQGSNGFWYGNNNRWYYYQSSSNYSSNTVYGYWSGNYWYTYVNYTGNTGNGYYGQFTDVSTNSYYYDAVNWMVSRGITSGTGNNTFSPDKTCSQAEVLTFIWRMYGSPSSSYACPVGGLSRSSYYYTALCWAGQKGLLSGTIDGADPTQVNCTRAMCVYYLWVAAGSPSVSSSSYSKFNDIPTNASYRSAVGWAVQKGITSGTSSSTFAPLDAVTRGQTATLLYRAYNVR